MAVVTVTKKDVLVSLELNEEEALYVLAALGKTTGMTPSVYVPLYNALEGAGFSAEFLNGQKVTIIGRSADGDRVA